MTRTQVGGSAVQVVDRLAGSEVQAVGPALLIEIGHLLSDVVTPAGLPLPGWTALMMSQATAESAAKAYVAGYDTWHVPAMRFRSLSSTQLFGPMRRFGPK